MCKTHREGSPVQRCQWGPSKRLIVWGQGEEQGRWVCSSESCERSVEMEMGRWCVQGYGCDMQGNGCDGERRRRGRGERDPEGWVVGLAAL